MNYVIVATGPSVQSLDEGWQERLRKNENTKIVAVNTATKFLKYYDYWFSLDPSPMNIRCANEAASKNAKCFVGISDDCKDSLTKLDKRVNIIERLRNNIVINNPRTPTEWFHRWGCKAGFSEVPGKVHSGNSAYGALNLVYQMNPDKVLLLGVDGSKSRSVGGNHIPRNLTHLNVLFQSAVPQMIKKNIRIVNASPNSIVSCFKKMEPNKAIDWILSK
jgi:hypothetical protein